MTLDNFKIQQIVDVLVRQGWKPEVAFSEAVRRVAAEKPHQ